MAVTRRLAGGRGLALVLGLATLVSADRAFAAWTITLVNDTGHLLTSYEVNPTPPPARLPAGGVAIGGTLSIDPGGLNPVLAWDSGISLTGMAPNGFYIGLGLTMSPPGIQYKLFHYKVTPGTPGADPARQPILLTDEVVEVTEGVVEIRVHVDWTVTIGPPSPLGRGACCNLTRCTNVSTADACSPGTFLPGGTCTPGRCTTASEVVGREGGTITTTGGDASLTFPPDCLDEDTAISFEFGNWPDRVYDVMVTGGDGNVVAAYTFEPNGLEFCDTAELCITVSLASRGLTVDDCDTIEFKHRKGTCVADPTFECRDDAECDPGDTCLFVFTDTTMSRPPDCSDPDNSRFCAYIDHFSDYGLVVPVDDDDDPVPPGFLNWFLIVVLAAMIAAALLYYRFRSPVPPLPVDEPKLPRDE